MNFGEALGGSAGGVCASVGPWQLPAGWAWASLGSLGRWTGGGTPSKANATFWTEGTVPWVSPKDMKIAVIGRTEDMITPAAVEGSSANYVPEGSVLMVMRSGILRHSFPVAVTDRIVTLNQDLRALSPYAGLSPSYVASYLTFSAQRILDDCSKDGTTVNSIEVSALERHLIPIAPSAEQQRIVARVDALFAEIAEGEAALARARKELDTFRRALLKAAVTGELTKDWRAANPVTETGHDVLARIAKERAGNAGAKGRGRRTTHTPPVDTSDLPMLPEGWAWATLGEVGAIETGGTPPTGDTRYYDGNIPFFKPTDLDVGEGVKAARTFLTDAGAERSTVALSGSVMVTCIGATIGKVGLLATTGAFNQQINSWTLAAPFSDGRWGYLWITSPFAQSEITKNASATTLPILNKSRFSALPMPVPPPTEAAEILRRISEALATSADTLAALNAEAADAARLRQSVLKAAFEGRLVPQDPADEPASVLLARLQALTPSKAAKRGRPRKSAQ